MTLLSCHSQLQTNLEAFEKQPHNTSLAGQWGDGASFIQDKIKVASCFVVSLYIYMYTTSPPEKRKAMEATESLTEAARTLTKAVEVLVLPTEHD